ncbi:hypothetical protein BDY17DRAFT_25171 [Neohortaea acidophila]|uniref:Uncharacterized protein n=1 Tax=Neohortaea acidophila TaxID=245834 RepID=A0A6A6Q858_9PEZI|nr:uncharacterized protein BDY17DRAFT_25171 [Neohortaea acidophila]KAF2488184.1 hypothetical protein BDY17DRAFT_25171 [Neohortaea acidophila]
MSRMLSPRQDNESHVEIAYLLDCPDPQGAKMTSPAAPRVKQTGLGKCLPGLGQDQRWEEIDARLLSHPPGWLKSKYLQDHFSIEAIALPPLALYSCDVFANGLLDAISRPADRQAHATKRDEQAVQGKQAIRASPGLRRLSTPLKTPADGSSILYVTSRRLLGDGNRPPTNCCCSPVASPSPGRTLLSRALDAARCVGVVIGWVASRAIQRRSIRGTNDVTRAAILGRERGGGRAAEWEREPTPQQFIKANWP